MTVEWSDTPEMPLIAGGKTLEYFCLGPAPDQAPTIVMLHEGLGCAALWRDFPQRVADATGMGVMVYSRQGYGQSDPAELPKPVDFMTREAVDVLPEILDQIGFQRVHRAEQPDGGVVVRQLPQRRIGVGPVQFDHVLGHGDRWRRQQADARKRRGKAHEPFSKGRSDPFDIHLAIILPVRSAPSSAQPCERQLTHS